MHIKKIVKPLTLTCFVFVMTSFCLNAAFSQPVIHHDLMVELTPEKNFIHVIDKINLSALYKKDVSATTPLVFLIHTGNSLRVVEKNINLKKQDYAFAKKHYPRLIGRELTVGRVPVDVYSVNVPKGQTQMTLEYERNIYHAIESGTQGGGRSISSSSGLIAEQGVFIAKESFWFPVFGDELLTFNLSVRLPSGWKSVSQGQRIYQESNATSHMDTWQETLAQDDIYLVAAKFTEYSQVAGPVKAMAFLRTPDEALAQKYLDTTAQYLEMYRNLLGPYPYSKFALVENFWETGFGMPSFTLLGPRIIRFPFILHSSYPHELLHNWWGNSVYVDYNKGNWAEGLTSYLADHLIKEQRGKGHEYRRTALQKYTNFANAENDFSLQQFVSRYDAVSEAVGYGKTLMLFHMLRQKLGDAVFTRGLQTLYRQYRQQTASYEDIENVFSDVSKKDLTRFFDQWLTKVGAPNLALKNASVKALASGKFRLQATIGQIQLGGSYQLDVPIVVTLEKQKKAKQFSLTMTGKTQIFDMIFDAQPLRLDIDPEFDVFRRLNVNEIPPALSEVFGAKQSLIVLPSKAPQKKLRAYERFAKNWQVTQQGSISIKYDSDLPRLPKGSGVWLLGWENKFRPDVERALGAYKTEFDDESIHLAGQQLNANKVSIVLVGRSTNPLGLISADTAEAIPGLARKLPHYGKYSYLAFEGTEPNNVLKGQWPIVNSPLSIQFSDPDSNKLANMATLNKRVALAAPTAVFSKKRLLNHVRQLASKEMQGRGLGTEALDKAAEYIAAEFRAAGLKPLMPTGSFFQDWQQKVNGKDSVVNMRNVVAYLPGSDAKYQGQSVVVSAHYDHIGLGGPGVRAGNEGKIHFGADDNASGVSVLLELGHLLAKKGQLARSVIFVAFTGEEANRLGSRYFVRNVPQFLPEDIFAAVNLDTVGRLGDNPLMVFGSGTASEWVHIFRGVGFVTGVNIKSLNNDLGASDQASFHEINVPAVQFFSGVNLDFHKPSDTFDKIDGPGLVKVAVALKETVNYLSERELPLNNLLDASLSKTKTSRRPTTGRRVSLGTVPDFAYQGKGVLVTEVVPDSPAALAEIKAKDILIEMNGKEVGNLRDFSAILRGLSPGDEVSLTLLREQKKIHVKTKVIAR